MRFRLRRIHLIIDRLNPDESFTFIDEIPDINIRLSFVRNLRISGSQAYEEDSEQNEIGREEIEEETFFAKPSPLCPSRLRSPLYESKEPPQAPEEILQMKIKYQETWVGIAKFISRLSCLSDLVYDCMTQVPSCLLSALRDNCPDARLHVYTFSLRSLYQPRNESHDISPEEYALATSPNLYGLYMKYCSYDGDGNIGYNEEAIIQMIRGLAPRLSYVGMAGQPVGGTIELAHAIQLHRQSGKPKWKGFFINGGQVRDNMQGKGSLHTLYLNGASELRIHQWSDYTDFNKLTKLHLGFTIIDAVQALAIIAEGGGLSSLSSLALMPKARNLEQAIAADESVCRLLQAMKPLQGLELEGEVGDSAWRAVIDQHGNSLRELRFAPAPEYYDNIEAFVLSCGRIRLLSGICLNLGKLELRIPRTRGDRDEVGIYQILGQLPRLKRISLVLDCSVIDPPEVRHGESFIEMGGWELPVNTFRAALINTAMDLALAQSIFDTIAAARAYTGGSSLVDLKLKIYGAGNFGRSSLDSEPRIPLEWVGQSWFVRRNSRNGGLVVQKIKSFVDDLDVLKDDFFERDDLRAVWMDVWPGSPGDRRNQWHSFPLATD
ncbi:protein kinase subdomain-containing protein [Trichoderma guizhouense]|uniref:Protein kinase subdomain-containing protein n=1 Tax=Trichoderma guizhouense TaxID=1491466 RepID=A0A1T3CU65_9HYPO|nr:protein kinase subdomain-containing protein [Trichoderma guizhouense]